MYNSSKLLRNAWPYYTETTYLITIRQFFFDSWDFENIYRKAYTETAYWIKIPYDLDLTAFRT